MMIATTELMSANDEAKLSSISAVLTTETKSPLSESSSANARASMPSATLTSTAFGSKSPSACS